MTESQSNRGRPEQPIIWPENEFTVNDVETAVGGKLKKVAIRMRINKAINKDKTLVEVGKTKTSSAGRPRITYRRVAVSVQKEA